MARVLLPPLSGLKLFLPKAQEMDATKQEALELLALMEGQMRFQLREAREMYRTHPFSAREKFAIEKCRKAIAIIQRLKALTQRYWESR